MMLDYLSKIRWDVFLFLLTAVDKKEMIRNQVFFFRFFLHLSYSMIDVYLFLDF